MELGGKDAAIVLDDPSGRPTPQGEIHRVESIVMRGVFQSAGQNCIGIERVIAMPKVYDALIKRLEPRIRAIRPGNDLDAGPSERDGVDMGAMISPASFDRLESLISEAVAQGARLLAGGQRYEHPRHTKGHYFEPTLLVDVTSNMRIANEELFAPICVFMRAESVDEAISLTNGTIYGLGCSVFGPTASSAARAQLDKVAREVKSGMVAVNDFAVFYAVQLPFGGVRGSGYGRFAGEEGLRGLCNIKSVCTDRWPGLIKTAIPPPLDYPMRPKAGSMAEGIVNVGYGETVMRKVRGVRKIVGV